MELNLGLVKELSWFLHMYPLMVLMMANLWVHFLVKCFDQTMELYLVVLLVVVTEIFTACVWEQHWEYHMNVPMVTHLD